MAIKNTSLGGTDWIDGESVLFNDMNDTFNAAYTKIQTLTTFWLNSDLYTVYDDFDGAVLDTDKWTVNTATVAISATNKAGNAVNEMKITAAKNVVAEVVSDVMPSNKHIHFNVYCDFQNPAAGSAYFNLSVGNDTDGWTIIKSVGGTSIESAGGETNTADVVITDFLIIAKGSNAYDTYLGGKRTNTNLSKANGLQLKFQASCSGTGTPADGYVYIDEVRTSKSSV